MQEAFETGRISFEKGRLVASFVAIFGKKEVEKQLTLQLEEIVVNDMVQLRLKIGNAKDSSRHARKHLDSMSKELQDLRFELQKVLKLSANSQIHLKMLGR